MAYLLITINAKNDYKQISDNDLGYSPSIKRGLGGVSEGEKLKLKFLVCFTVVVRVCILIKKNIHHFCTPHR